MKFTETYKLIKENRDINPLNKELVDTAYVSRPMNPHFN